MKNYWKILITLVCLISSCNLATAQYPIKKTIGKDTVVILTNKQADVINESFDFYRGELSKTKIEADSLKVKLELKEQKYKKLNKEHQRTLVSLLVMTEKYDVLSKTGPATLMKKLDRNASLTVMSIVFTSLILIAVQR